MKHTWTAESDKLLLLGLIDRCPPVSRDNWQKIAEAVGGGITGESCRQRVITLKRQALGNPRTKSKVTDTPTTPSKKDNRAVEHDCQEVETPVRRSSTRKRTAIRYVEPDDSTEEEGSEDMRSLESPTKKIKIEDEVEFPDIQAAEKPDGNEAV